MASKDKGIGSSPTKTRHSAWPGVQWSSELIIRPPRSISHTSALVWLVAAAPYRLLHKQSSTLKQIPMRHVTGRLWQAVHYMLVKRAVAASLHCCEITGYQCCWCVWASACAGFCAYALVVLWVHVWQCFCSCFAISGTKVCLCCRWMLKVKPPLKKSTLPRHMNKSTMRGSTLCNPWIYEESSFSI